MSLGEDVGLYMQWPPAAEKPRWPALVAVAAAGVLAGFVGGFSASSSSTTTAFRTTTLATSAQLSASVAPAKFALAGETPTDFQLQRGDCWLFATVSLLEDSYRRQGVEKGYLRPDEYLRLSRQAYGVAVLEACRAAPQKCMFDGDAVYTGNSTTGGEVEFTYFLQKQLSDAALPMSVCPYQSTTQGAGEVASTDLKCDNLADARAHNPLRFSVKNLRTHFDRQSIKEALRTRGRAMALISMMIVVPYWLPCTPFTKDKYLPGGGAALAGAAVPNLGPDDNHGGTNGPTCESPSPCPLDRAYSGADGCIPTNRPMYTMKAEWFHRSDEPQLIKEGGHAITLVGYSDTWRSEEGYVGGYIIKNSWEDGLGASHGAPARGSHTLAYFMQQISDFDERDVCPNVNSPRSWYSCPDLASCKSEKFRWFARSVRQVLHLQCHASNPVASGLCDEGERLFLRNTTGWGGGLTVACFLRDSPKGDQSPDLCTPPLWLDDLATIFAPAAEDFKPNDADRCGYYFVPYETFEAINAAMGGCWVSELDIEWSDDSYLANARSGKDYSLVKKDTKSMPPLVSPGFIAPQPPFTRQDLKA